MVEGRNRKDIIVIDILERCKNTQFIIIRQNCLVKFKGYPKGIPSYFLNENVCNLEGFSLGFDDILVIDIE